MDSSIANLLLYVETNNDIWDNLKEMFGEQNNLARVYEIQNEIAQLTIGDKAIVLYLDQMRSSLYDELLQYHPTTFDPKKFARPLTSSRLNLLGTKVKEAETETTILNLRL
ncbi:hypothetical protein EJ110_NYTH26557 [Nymphaea thermarum]|nr:hypothetical protein EJ110_NYTH26557 [Nymphaea thermarum]